MADEERREEGGNGEEEEVDGKMEVEGKGSGVLLGMKLAVSCLFSSDDQSLAASILRQQGGENFMYVLPTCTSLPTLFVCSAHYIYEKTHEFLTWWCYH